jgi:hypothetical protein
MTIACMKKPALDAQHDKFIEAAKGHGYDESEKAFSDKPKKITKKEEPNE